MPLPSSGSRRRVGLGHQHVAVGQHVQPARMVQPLGEGRHAQPAAAVGAAPAGQPSAGAMLTVGISDACGGGSSGSGPVPAETGLGSRRRRPGRRAASRAEGLGRKRAWGRGSADLRQQRPSGSGVRPPVARSRARRFSAGPRSSRTRPGSRIARARAAPSRAASTTRERGRGSAARSGGGSQGRSRRSSRAARGRPLPRASGRFQAGWRAPRPGFPPPWRGGRVAAAPLPPTGRGPWPASSDSTLTSGASGRGRKVACRKRSKVSGSAPGGSGVDASSRGKVRKRAMPRRWAQSATRQERRERKGKT